MSATPSFLEPAFVPAELHAQPHWVVWLFDGSKKRPFSVTTGRTVKWRDDPVRLSQALAALRKPLRWGQADRLPAGVGFILGAGFCGLDLDRCFYNAEGKRKLYSWARPIVDVAKASACWIEYSPSGLGLHIVGRGTVLTPLGSPFEMRQAEREPVPAGKPSMLEFHTSQYFTVTGNAPSSHRPAVLGDIGPVWCVAEDAATAHSKPRIAPSKKAATKADVRPDLAVQDDTEMPGSLVRQAPANPGGRSAGVPANVCDTPLALLNHIAVGRLHDWFAAAFPCASQDASGVWKIASEDLGAESGNRLSADPLHGIKDFVALHHDPDDKRAGSRTPIDMLLRAEYAAIRATEFSGAQTAVGAAGILAKHLGLTWVANSIRREHRAASLVDVRQVPDVALQTVQWPTGLLPGAFEQWAHETAASMGLPNAALQFTGFVSMAAAIPMGVSFTPMGDGGTLKISPALFGMLVAGSGVGKSGAWTAALSPIHDAHKEWLHEYQRKHGSWNARATKQAKAAQDDVAVPPDDSETVVVPEVSEPRLRRRLVASATPEAFIKLMAHSREGLIMAVDELSGFFGSIDRFAKGSTGVSGDSGTWLSAYDGGYLNTERVGRDSVTAAESHLSIVGSMTPGVLIPVLNTLSASGLLQRFTICCLGPEPVKLSQRRPAAILLEQHALAVQLLLNVASGDRPLALVPDAGAQAEWFAQVERASATLSGTASETEQGFLGKFRGLLGRLTAALHLIGWAWNEAAEILASGGMPDDATAPALIVPRETVLRAARIYWEVLWPNVRQICSASDQLGGADDTRVTAQFVWAHAQANEELSTRDLYRGVRRFSSDKVQGKSRLEAVLGSLEHAGWLEPISDARGNRWRILPGVKDLPDSAEQMNAPAA